MDTYIQIWKIYSFWPSPDIYGYVYTDMEDLFILAIAPHKGVQMDDLPPLSTYYNYAYEKEKQQSNDSVLELGT